MEQNYLKKSDWSQTFTVGMAMFAMLFGAGNVVFSLALGRDMGNMVGFAIIGFIATAVLVPMLGLVASILFEGKYEAFLGRMGAIPGALMALAILLLIGPFGGIPRCITTAYAAVKWYTPEFTLFYFSLVTACIVFMFSFKETRVVDLIGKFLGPIKLSLLLAIIFVGIFWMQGRADTVSLPAGKAVLLGAMEGYGTMDLLAALFFAGLLFSNLKRHNPHDNPKQLAVKGFKASLFGSALLIFVYTGFCLVASFHGPSVGDVDRYELLNALAPFVLGPQGGFLTNAAVATSCLVTAIALTTVFARYLQETIFRDKVSYVTALVVTVATSTLLANLGFHGVMGIIAPCVVLLYPAMIMLALLNLCHKLFGTEIVFGPVFATFLATGVYQLLV